MMDYAGKYNSRNGRQRKASATAETLFPVGQFCKDDAKGKRCAGSAKGQAETVTATDAANAFLKTTFLPKIKLADSVQTQEKKTERDICQSLSRLAQHYQLHPLETENYIYPYNVALLFWDMERKLKKNVPHFYELTLAQSERQTSVVSTEIYDTGQTLFYIPVEPLYLMLKDRRYRITGQMLLSVFSYLYHVVDIPYYRQEDSYLFALYEMLYWWVEDDEDMNENQEYKAQLLAVEKVGDAMEQKIYNRQNLEVFSERIARFKSKDTFDEACYSIACKAFDLYMKYPDVSIFSDTLRNTDLNGEEETISMQKYISFYANGKGVLSESLIESINTEFNEYGDIEEPTIHKKFGMEQLPDNHFDFVDGIFAVISGLADLLDNFKTSRT